MTHIEAVPRRERTVL